MINSAFRPLKNIGKTIQQLSLKRKALVLAIIFAFSFGLYTFKPFGLFNGAAVKSYRTEKVVSGDLSAATTASGTVEASNKATISFLTSGRVAWVGFKEGDQIKAGQIIASLDSADQQIAVSKAEAALKSAQSVLDKILDDNRMYRYTADEYGETQTQKTSREQAEMARDTAYQELQRAKKQFEWGTIIAPFDGVITDLSGIEVGQNITPASGTSVTIVGNGPYKFAANIDETEFSKLTLGKEGKIVLDAYPEKSFIGQVVKIGAAAIKLSTGGSVVPVELSLIGDEMLKDGLNGEVEFNHIIKEDVLSVPRSSLKTEGDKSYLFIEAESGKSKKYVTVGELVGIRAEIKAGVSDGEIVILGDVKK